MRGAVPRPTHERRPDGGQGVLNVPLGAASSGYRAIVVQDVGTLP